MTLNTRCPTEETIQLPSVFFSQLISFPFKKYGISSLLELGLYSLSPSIPSLTSNLCFPLFWNCSFILFCLFPIVFVCQLISPLLNSSYASSKDRREIDCLLGSQAFERLCTPDHPCTEGLLAFERCVHSTHIYVVDLWPIDGTLIVFTHSLLQAQSFVKAKQKQFNFKWVL